MVETILKSIQDTAMKYAKVLSQVLKVDVEIVDNNLVRIAGTGKYEEAISISMESEGYVYKKVLCTGESQIIKDPGENEVCVACPRYKTCIEKFEMCVPIKMDNQIVGVIGLICFDDEQREFILERLEAYHSFLCQIADFISAKASESIEKEKTMNVVRLLNSVTNEIEEAVIILNAEGYLIHANAIAYGILGTDEEKLKGKKIICEHTGRYFLDKKEYLLSAENKSLYLVGYMTTIEDSDEDSKIIFVFSERKTIKNQIDRLTDMEDNVVFDNILGTSEMIMTLKNNILKIADSTSTVLIAGESGVGKEMVARAIHRASERKDKPFIPINCGAIPEEILEIELFGDDKGKQGKFKLADKGALFLNEIGDVPLHMQTKLLRVLQDMEITPVGKDQPEKIDVRILAATNKDLEELVELGKFRQDLYYRLSVIPIEVPALRKRTEDIKIITYYYLNKYSKLFNKKFVGVDSDVWKYMYKYDWPGNVIELQNTTEFMINMMDDSGIITAHNLPKRVVEKGKTLSEIDLNESLNLKKIELETIKKALDLYGNTTKGKKDAADSLGIGIATLYRKIEEYKLTKL